MSNSENIRVNHFPRIFWILALIVFGMLLLPVVRRFFFETGGRWLYILLFSFSTSALLTPLMILTA
ncbi:MAG: hypothetical protein ACYC6Q_09290, partial [Syntrophales bacterium]